MKKILVLLLVTFSLNILAQEKMSEGVITMSQTMVSDDEAVAAQLASMGQITSSTYFKKGKSRAEVSNQMTGDITVIIDQESQEMLMLMDNPYMGKSYAKKVMELTQEQLDNITVVESDETKNVLGYECKRVDLTVKDNGVETTIKFYMTNAIEVPTQQTAIYGSKLKGMPMYMEMTMNQMGMQMIMKFEVTEIKKESVDDSKFDMTIPEGYKENQALLKN
jgi:hypothetical protein